MHIGNTIVRTHLGSLPASTLRINSRKRQVVVSASKGFSRLGAESKIETPQELRIAEWTGSESQQRALEELNRKLDGVADKTDSETILWFLRDRNYDPAEAEEKLLKTLRWKQEIDWDNLSPSDFSQEYALGKVKVHNHFDVLDRPVILLDASKHHIGEFPTKSTEKLCAFAVKEALRVMPEGKETFISIFDLRHFGTSNADLKFVKYMVDLFFVYHPKRLGQSLLVEPPWVFKPVWQFVKPLLRKYASLVRFVTAEEVRTEYFTNETLPVEFKL